MGRHPDGATARTEWLKLRITPEGRAVIESAARSVGETVSEYVRKAVQQRVKRGNA